LNILNKLQLEFGFHNWQHWYIKRNNKWNNATITFIKFNNGKNISNMINFLRYIRFELVLNDIITNIYIHMNYIYIYIYIYIKLFFSLYWVVLLLVIKLKELLFQTQTKLLSIYENAFALSLHISWVINCKNLFICGNLTSIDFIPMFLNHNFFNTNHIIILFQTQSVLQIDSQYIVHW